MVMAPDASRKDFLKEKGLAEVRGLPDGCYRSTGPAGCNAPAGQRVRATGKGIHQHPTRGTESDQLLLQCGRPLTVISTSVRWWNACSSLRVTHWERTRIDS